MSRKPNINDVALAAGVSKATVSRFINGGQHVSAEVKARIQSAIDKLDYVVDITARALSEGRTQNITFVYPIDFDIDSNTYYNAHLETGMLRACVENGLSLINFPIYVDTQNVKGRIAQIIDNHASEGLIFTPPFSDDIELIEYVRGRNFPLVCISSHLGKAQKVDGVGMDDEAAGYELTKYLLGLGHRHFVYARGLIDHLSAASRYQGFCRALSEQGNDVVRHKVLSGGSNFASGLEIFDAFHEDPDKGSCILCENDEIAAGVIYRAYQLGVNIPRYVSVAGFDDAPFSKITCPPLTTMRQPIIEIGRNVVLRLKNLIGKDKSFRQPQFDFLPHKLIVRDSTAAILPDRP